MARGSTLPFYLLLVRLRQLLQSCFNQLTCSTHSSPTQLRLCVRLRLRLRLRWRQQEDTTLRCCLLKLICQCQVLCFIFPFGFFFSAAAAALFFSVKLLRTQLPLRLPLPLPCRGTHAAAARNLYQWRVLSWRSRACVAFASAQIRQQLRADNRKRDKRQQTNDNCFRLTDTPRNFN